MAASSSTVTEERQVIPCSVAEIASVVGDDVRSDIRAAQRAGLRATGDPETISIKSSGNIVRYNTLRSTSGEICLRHGNENQVYGNYILGEGVGGSRGLRIYGADHRIRDHDDRPVVFHTNGRARSASNIPVVREPCRRHATGRAIHQRFRQFRAGQNACLFKG